MTVSRWTYGVLGFAFAVFLAIGIAPTVIRQWPTKPRKLDPTEAIRLGNEVFEQQDFEEALRRYEAAEAETIDPGLVSYNKASAYYRLGMLRQAIDGYRRCLDDDEAPASRRARAHYDLGNALVRYGPDNDQQLSAAVLEYRKCLASTNLPTSLRADARHNLELAQLLWLKAWKKLPDAQKNTPEKKTHPDEKKQEPDEYKEVNIAKDEKPKASEDVSSGKKSKDLRTGTPMSLPDNDSPFHISGDDALATLLKHAERIAEARRQHRNPSGPATLSTKDW